MTNKKFSRKRPKGPTLAELTDKHELYEMAVQSPEFELEFFEQRFIQLRKRKPLSLQEDFCGTGRFMAEWCESDPKRTARGVDLDGATLQWCRDNNISAMSDDAATRLELVQANVLDVERPAVDICCAMNFSYCVFKTRKLLRDYFSAVHKGLKPDGLFFLDLLGGTETMDVVYEERDIEESDTAIYVWEQESFNPVNHDLLAHIHFEFVDGSTMEKAFTYDWRLWTLPELQEILEEAGFSKVRVFWEKYEDDGDEDNEYLEGTGEYVEVTSVDQQESWLAYIVAEA